MARRWDRGGKPTSWCWAEKTGRTHPSFPSSPTAVSALLKRGGYRLLVFAALTAFTMVCVIAPLLVAVAAPPMTALTRLAA